MNLLVKYRAFWFLGTPLDKTGTYALISRCDPGTSIPLFRVEVGVGWLAQPFRSDELEVYPVLHRGGLLVGMPSWAPTSTVEKPVLAVVSDGITLVESVPDSERLPFETDRWVRHDPRENTWVGEFNVDEIGKIKGPIDYSRYGL